MFLWLLVNDNDIETKEKVKKQQQQKKTKQKKGAVNKKEEKSRKREIHWGIICHFVVHG